MSDNPYQAPQTITQVTGVLSGSHDDLRRVALYQKGIIVCILIYIAAVFGQFALPQELRPLVGLGILFVMLVGAVCVFLLAMRTHGALLGIVLGILSMVPLIGLLILLIVNGKATHILRQNGIKVGLLGAKASSV